MSGENEPRVSFPRDELEEWLSGLETEYREMYRGDWDWVCHTTFKLEGCVIKAINKHYDNGIKPPDDSEEIVLRGEVVQECPRCKQMGVLWNLGEMCDEELFSLLEKIGQEIRS